MRAATQRISTRLSHTKNKFKKPVSLQKAAAGKKQGQPDTGKGNSNGNSRESLNSGLAICLFGFGAKMYDSEYEEEVRKQAVMNEVLPDAAMWLKWEKTEAPLRQGRGWYPTLDRHFLELLVVSEIACLSHPLHLPSPQGQADRVHRHASRVRRVACERIGAERLHAYCERVKEAFEAYVRGGWRRYGEGEGEGEGAEVASGEGSSEEGEDDAVNGEGEGEVFEHMTGVGQVAKKAGAGEDLEGAGVGPGPGGEAGDGDGGLGEQGLGGQGRGRKMTREGSANRASPPSPHGAGMGGATGGGGGGLIVLSPTALAAIKSSMLSPPSTPPHDTPDPFSDEADLAELEIGEGGMMRIDLDDVSEGEEEESSGAGSERSVTRLPGVFESRKDDERMDLDTVVDVNVGMASASAGRARPDVPKEVQDEDMGLELERVSARA